MERSSLRLADCIKDICNDMDEQLNVPLTDVVEIGYLIEGYCGNDNIGPFTHFSGQAFVATGKRGTIISSSSSSTAN